MSSWTPAEVPTRLEVESVHGMRFDQRDLDVVDADTGADNGYRHAVIGARNGDVFPVSHLDQHAVESFRDPNCPSGIAGQEDIACELRRSLKP
jgi:hypothetical protein